MKTILCLILCVASMNLAAQEATPPAAAPPVATPPELPPPVLNEVPEPKVVQPEKPKPRWHFVLGLGHMIGGGKGQFDDATYSSSTDFIAGEAEFEYSKTYALIAEGRYLPPNSWCFLGGLNYEGEREFERGELRGDGETITLTGGSGASKVQFTTLYASAAYRWKEFYLPFGLNSSGVKFTPARGFTGSHSASGGLGAQAGMGWMIQDRFAVEVYTWVTSMKLKTSASGATIDYGQGYFQSFLLVGKFAF
jgi:hypothetical protein